METCYSLIKKRLPVATLALKPRLKPEYKSWSRFSEGLDQCVILLMKSFLEAVCYHLLCLIL